MAFEEGGDGEAMGGEEEEAGRRPAQPFSSSSPRPRLSTTPLLTAPSQVTVFCFLPVFSRNCARDSLRKGTPLCDRGSGGSRLVREGLELNEALERALLQRRRWDWVKDQVLGPGVEATLSLPAPPEAGLPLVKLALALFCPENLCRSWCAILVLPKPILRAD